MPIGAYNPMLRSIHVVQVVRACAGARTWPRCRAYSTAEARSAAGLDHALELAATCTSRRIWGTGYNDFDIIFGPLLTHFSVIDNPTHAALYLVPMLTGC